MIREDQFEIVDVRHDTLYHQASFKLLGSPRRLRRQIGVIPYCIHQG